MKAKKATLAGLPPGILKILIPESDVALFWSAQSDKEYKKMQLISSSACCLMLNLRPKIITIGRKKFRCHVIAVTSSMDLHAAHLAVRVRLSGRTKI